MIAKQSIFTNLERDKAFPEGHENANLLLVRQGQEISESELEKYEGAADLADTEVEEKEQPIIPPPNLKQHGTEDAGGEIPAPKIKNVQDEKEPSAKPAAPVKGKTAKAPKAKKAAKPKK